MLKSFFRFFPKPGVAALAAGGWALAVASPARATVTIEFFYEDGTLADGSVAVLVADVNGDGFLSPTDPSVSGTVLAEGEFVGGSDDVILAVLQADDGLHWNDSAGIADTIERIGYPDFGIVPGTPLVLYLFPDITRPGDLIVVGDDVVSYRNAGAGGSSGDNGFVAPADPGVYTIAALPGALGGDFDPQNPGPGETYDQANTGVPGSSGGGGTDDHGNNRANATLLPTGQAVSGILSPGDFDFFSIAINGLSRVTAYTIGATDTTGYLYQAGGALLNDPGANDDNNGDLNFRFEQVVDATGTLHLAVRGKNDNQSGAYEIVVEVVPVESFRPDLTIGKTRDQQRGDGRYSLSGADQKFRQVSKNRRKVTFFFKVQNDGILFDIITVTGTPGNRLFRVNYIKASDGGDNVTSKFEGEGYRARLAEAEEEVFKLKVRPTHRAKRRRKRRTFEISAASTANLRDQVKAKVQAK